MMDTYNTPVTTMDAVLYHVNIFGMPNIEPYYEDLCVTCLVSYNTLSIGMADNNK